jgi:hypothetical protein
MVTFVTSFLLLALPAVFLWTGEVPLAVTWSVGLMSVLILVATWSFAPRAYEIDGHGVVVHRGLGCVRLPLAEVRGCRIDPAAMERSWRLLGSGGLFGFFGLFRNARLGTFRAFATNPAMAVVIESGGKPWVLTPAEPASLVRKLEQAMRADSR